MYTGFWLQKIRLETTSEAPCSSSKVGEGGGIFGRTYMLRMRPYWKFGGSPLPQVTFEDVSSSNFSNMVPVVGRKSS